MLIDESKHLAAARAAVNRQFCKDDGASLELSGAAHLICESALLRLRRAGDRILTLAETYAQLRDRLTRTRRTESRTEPSPLRLVRPAQPAPVPEAKAL